MRRRRLCASNVYGFSATCTPVLSVTRPTSSGISLIVASIPPKDKKEIPPLGAFRAVQELPGEETFFLGCFANIGLAIHRLSKLLVHPRKKLFS